MELLAGEEHHVHLRRASLPNLEGARVWLQRLQAGGEHLPGRVVEVLQEQWLEGCLWRFADGCLTQHGPRSADPGSSHHALSYCQYTFRDVWLLLLEDCREVEWCPDGAVPQICGCLGSPQLYCSDQRGNCRRIRPMAVVVPWWVALRPLTGHEHSLAATSPKHSPWERKAHSVLLTSWAD